MSNKLDIERIHTILSADHSYYGSRKATKRKDQRLISFSAHFPFEYGSTMRVLDLGCGNGDTLLYYSGMFHTGLGIDIDDEFLQLAEESRQEKNIHNVEFRKLDFPCEVNLLTPGSFDLVYSERGPIDLSVPFSFEAAVSLLRPDGLIFCEEIGELHLFEVDAVFDPPPQTTPSRIVDQFRLALEQNGISIRLAADIFAKWYYPDVYEWLLGMCSIWSWLNIPFPEADDPRITLFAEQNTISTGEIEVTHHIVWVGGVKERRNK